MGAGGGEVLVGGGGEGLEGGDVAVASGTTVAVGSLMGASGVAVASDSVARTSGAVVGLAGRDAAFSVGPGSDFGPCGPLGAVEAAGCSVSVLKASDHQSSPRVPGPDRTWTTPFRSTPTLDDWVVML